MRHQARKLIMLYGCPLAGKSTAAEKIRQFLCNKGMDAMVISSAKLRLHGKRHGSTTAFIDENNRRTRAAKDRAYQKMCVKAEKCLAAGVVPILDATFHLYHRRKRVYETAESHGAQPYVVWLVFGNEAELKKHLRRRMLAKKLNALHTWQQYATMAEQTEGLTDYELAKSRAKREKAAVKIIRFDRGSRKITLHNCSSKDAFARQIISAITR
ncbi:AAA family ATPase [Candidatus Woesearchaeota archaeon]|nr:AAA family ATPase [Candidatus Woesearchaeota archaeon]